MCHNFRSLLIFVLVSPLLVQCVPTGQDITTLDLRVRSLDNKMLKMDQKVTDIAKKSAKNRAIEALQEKQADMSNTLDRLNMEFLQIKGQLEENSHFYQTSKNATKELEGALDKRLVDLADQIMLLADQMNKTAGDIDVVKKSGEDTKIQLQAAEKRAREIEKNAATAIAEAEKKVADAEAAAALAAAAEVRKAREEARIPTIVPDQVKSKYMDGKKIVQKTTKKTVVAPSTSTTVVKGPGKDIYNRALDMFRAGKYNQAYRVFNDYLEQNPTGKMAPNARFWLGDCYYNQQEYELAILEYQKVIADFTKHPKAPAALLKQGLAFEKLKDKATAIIVYRKLLEDYPKSEQFGAAKKMIERLK